MRLFKVRQRLAGAAVTAQDVSEQAEAAGQLRAGRGLRRTMGVNTRAERLDRPAHVVLRQAAAPQVVSALGDVGMAIADRLAPHRQRAFVESNRTLRVALLAQQPGEEAKRVRDAGVVRVL